MPDNSRPATVYDKETEQKALGLFDKLQGEGIEWKRRVTAADWQSGKDYWRGSHWPERKSDGYVPRVVANEVKKVVMQTVAMLTDVRPRSEVVPAPLSHSGDDFALWLEHSARMLNHGVKAIWQNMDVDSQIEQSLVDMELMFKGIQKVVWNPTANGGLGEAQSFRVDPEYLIVDPYCLDLDDAQYMIHRTPRPLSYIRRRWPHKGFNVPADMALSTWSRGETPQQFLGKIGLRKYRQEDRYEQSAIPRAWVDELWIIDPTIDKATEALLYPGRRVMTRSGNVMLQDTGNPFWDDMHPFVEIPAFPAIEAFWEQAPVMGYLDMQDMVNKFWSIIMSNAMQTGNTQWIGDKDALSPEGWDNLGNAPGGIIQIKPGRNLRREPPPTLPQWIMEAAKAASVEIKELAGLLDPGMMKAGGGMTPGGFVDSMVLALQAVIRYKARSLEKAEQQIGLRLISRMLQFYTQRRVMTMEGMEGWQQMTWEPELVIPNVGQAATREDLVRWAIKRYQYRVTPGSSLSLSKEKQWAVSAALFGMQAIDKEALLEDVDYPRRQEVMARMKAEEEKAKMAAAMAGGGQPPAKQAGPAARAQQPYKSRSAASSIIKGLTRSATKNVG